LNQTQIKHQAFHYLAYNFLLNTLNTNSHYDNHYSKYPQHFNAFAIMVASATVLAALANIFISQSLAAAVPKAVEKVVARGGGYPASNPVGVSCYNTWETVTNDVRKRYIPSSSGVIPLF
jgi:hypothetical protein